MKALVGTFAATTTLRAGTAGRTVRPTLSAESCGGGPPKRPAERGGFRLESDHGERHGYLSRRNRPCHTRLTGRSPLLLSCAVTPRHGLHRISAFAVTQRRSSKCRDFRSRQPGV